jgi:hypothetical protein
MARSNKHGWQMGDLAIVTTFSWAGARLPYFDHPYNRTALNMRRIEIPIVRWYMRQALSAKPDSVILEVGNVLSHYEEITWPVVDMEEPGCINMDVRDYTTDTPVDLLISISTVEHITEEPAANIYHLRSLLASDGLGVVTVPLRYNRHLDNRLAEGLTGASAVYAMRMIGGNEWAECTLDEGLEAGRHGQCGKWRYGMAVLELRALDKVVPAGTIVCGQRLTPHAMMAMDSM